MIRFFRPRYSLLTLLLFTAFVAGGVKLWRGPHRVIFNIPHFVDPNLFPLFWPDKRFQYEYEYFNNWHGRRYTYLLARPKVQICVIQVPEQDAFRVEIERNSVRFVDPTRDVIEWSSLKPFNCRRLKFKIYPARDSTLDQEYGRAKPSYPPPYYVDDQGQIYTVKVISQKVYGTPISLAEIPYSELQTIISNEITDETETIENQ